MTIGQFAYVAGLILIAMVVFIGSLILPMSVFMALLLVAFGFAEWFRREITPAGEKPQSPFTILEESPLWRAAAIAYLLLIVLVVAYHLGVDRISFFENINLPIFLVLILGAFAGPIAIHVSRTYQALDRRDQKSDENG